MPPTTPLQFDALRERRIELLVARMLAPEADDDLQMEVLCRDPICVVAGRRSKWVRRRKIDLAELVDEPWIVTPANSEPWSLLAEAFGRKGLAVPSGTVVSTSIHIANRLVPTGRYLTIIPELAPRFGPMTSRMQVLPVDFPSAPRPIAIVTLKNRMLSPAAHLFVEAARLVTRPSAKEARR